MASSSSSSLRILRLLFISALPLVALAQDSEVATHPPVEAISHGTFSFHGLTEEECVAAEGYEWVPVRWMEESGMGVCQNSNLQACSHHGQQITDDEPCYCSSGLIDSRGFCDILCEMGATFRAVGETYPRCECSVAGLLEIAVGADGHETCERAELDLLTVSQIDELVRGTFSVNARYFEMFDGDDFTCENAPWESPAEIGLAVDHAFGRGFFGFVHAEAIGAELAQRYAERNDPYLASDLKSKCESMKVDYDALKIECGDALYASGLTLTPERPLGGWHNSTLIKWMNSTEGNHGPPCYALREYYRGGPSDSVNTAKWAQGAVQTAWNAAVRRVQRADARDHIVRGTLSMQSASELISGDNETCEQMSVDNLDFLAAEIDRVYNTYGAVEDAASLLALYERDSIPEAQLSQDLRTDCESLRAGLVAQIEACRVALRDSNMSNPGTWHYTDMMVWFGNNVGNHKAMCWDELAPYYRIPTGTHTHAVVVAVKTVWNELANDDSQSQTTIIP